MSRRSISSVKRKENGKKKLSQCFGVVKDSPETAWATVVRGRAHARVFVFVCGGIPRGKCAGYRALVDISGGQQIYIRGKDTEIWKNLNYFWRRPGEKDLICAGGQEGICREPNEQNKFSKIVRWRWKRAKVHDLYITMYFFVHNFSPKYTTFFFCCS
jgi:hypothetical protein